MVPAPAENVYATSKKIKFAQYWLSRQSEKLGREVKVLDFGCGNGEELARYIVSETIDYTGIDIHLPSLEHARAELGNDKAVFLSEVPDGEKYDVIIMSEVLEHLDEPVEILKRLVPKLRSDGIFICSVPNGYGLTEIEKYVDAKLRLYKALRWAKRKIAGRHNEGPSVMDVPYNYESGHVQFYTKCSLRRVVQKAGLDFKAFQNGSLMGADLTGATIFLFKPLIKLNTCIADFLPFWAVATWHFVLCRSEEK
ncbi:MAG: class I SAM-dependent methyltransferase [Thalassospira sp.]|uniref:class I SAM-dependent methyltransferase n=1 Tax=Thalassospira sp. TaxID=1912094 RepID=UPI003A8419E8